MVFNTIMNLLFSDSTTNKYAKYESVLEFLPEYTCRIINFNIDKENLLVKTIKKYLQFYCETYKCNKFVVSLSGGVDSMVLITIIKYLHYNVAALHINYNNRSETLLEQKFLEEWCYYNSIPLHTKSITYLKRGEMKRSDYENQTRIIRYNFYKEVLKIENVDSIMLAHHKDDIVENIFANVCRGRNILDLAAITDSAEIDGVKILRPMLAHFKDDIYDFSSEYYVPYFKDTTPSWSVRGKYREKLYPMLIDTFSFNIKENLLKMSEQSEDWKILVNNEIINPFMQKVKFNDRGCVFIVEENYISHPITFWTVVFQKIFYKFGKSIPSKKGITSFMNNIKSKNVSYISISNTCVCRNKNYEITIEFKLAF